MLINGHLVAVVFISLIVGKGYAVRCFSCNSIDDYRCGDNFRLTNVEGIECPGTCSKKRGERWEGQVRIVEVIRGCLVQTTEKCYNENQGGINFKVCTCNTDFCNHGNHTQSLLALIMCVLILAYNHL
ncbi:uncharacterized protein LOC121375637 [Gigantopelta aegis]|uniref:uncharacterized protein LOC121375637 n=1 Tax=Gigantopelta aegis TaxID=1735272 RepID=UPI001B88DF48|nr:uncharacterized protein LOC121375637 [Gigantopelta aegis]